MNEYMLNTISKGLMTELIDTFGIDFIKYNQSKPNEFVFIDNASMGIHFLIQNDDEEEDGILMTVLSLVQDIIGVEEDKWVITYQGGIVNPCNFI